MNYPGTFSSVTSIPERCTMLPVLEISGGNIRVLEALRKGNPLSDINVVVSELPEFHSKHTLDFVQPLRLNQTDNHRFRLSSPVR